MRRALFLSSRLFRAKRIESNIWLNAQRNVKTFERRLAFFSTSTSAEEATPALTNARAQFERALQLYGQQDFQNALGIFKESLSTFETELPADHIEISTCLNNIGECCRSLGIEEGTEAIFRRSLEIRERESQGQPSLFVATTANNLGLFLMDQRRFEEAQKLFKQAIEYRKTLLGAEHPETAVATSNFGLCLTNAGKYQDAIPILTSVVPIFETSLGKDNHQTANAINNLGLTYMYLGVNGEAQKLITDAMERFKAAKGEECTDVAMCHNNLALLFFNEKKFEKALPLFEKAVASYTRILGDQHKTVALILFNYGVCMQKAGGRKKEAREIIEKAKRLAKGH